MANIFVTKNRNDAEVKIFQTEYDFLADLLYHPVDNDFQAKGDALWHYVAAPWESTVIVYWTDYEQEADIKVFKVPNSWEAEWLTSNPWRGRLC